MEDAAIVELYWQRSEEAIPETEQKYGKYCGAIAKNICHSPEDAEECVNDTWLRAWNRMPSERPSVLSTFLGTITRNLALNRWRIAHRQKRGGGETDLALEELSECVPAPGGVERELEAKHIFTVVRSLNIEFQMRIAARACTSPIGTDMLEALPIKDFERIMNRVRAFFAAAE